MMKKIMLIGPRGSGKSTLANRIEGDNRPLRHTQDVIYRVKTMDVPAAYLENRWMYRHIIAMAQNQANLILMLVPQEHTGQFYSPNFVRVFTCPVIGVITHVPAETAPAMKACHELQRAGVPGPYYPIDLIQGNGLEPLQAIIKDTIGGD